MTRKILVINGPNLNKLGTRQPEIYGRDTLKSIEEKCAAAAKKFDMTVEFRQSNHEGDLVDWIQEAAEKFDGLIINPAAYSHTSIAVMDALLNCAAPKIEVHLSNIHQREEFRHLSYVSKAADAVLCGFGAYGYEMAVAAMAQHFLNNEKNG